MKLELLKKSQVLVLFLLLIVVGVIVVFFNFFFGNQFLLFSDAARDSINSYYPYAVNFSEQFRTYFYPTWSFKMGLGQFTSRELSDPFYLLLSLFPKETIPKAFVYLVALKIFLAGLFFYKYLELLHFNSISRILGGLFYAFSGFLILGSNWFLLSTDVVYVALILYSYELFLYKKNIILLSISLSLFWLGMPLNIYFAALFLFIYSSFRYFQRSLKFSFQELISLYSKLFIVGVLALGISAVLLLPATYQIYMSPRISGGVSYSGNLLSNISFREDAMGFFTIIGRTFSSDMLGSAWKFSGKWNYLEAPMSYIGILPLILFPNIFLFVNKKTKLLIGVAIFLLFSSLFVPFVRNAIWLFQGEYFRIYGFMTSVAILILGIFVFNKIQTKKQEISLYLPIFIALFYILLLILPDIFGLNIYAKKLKLIAIFFIISYTLLFLSVIKYPNSKKIAFLLILVLSFGEVILMSYRTINRGDAITTEDFKKGKGYNDYTSEVVEKLQKEDSSFYRISKDYLSSPAATSRTGHNDALVQGYYGVSSYNSFNQVNYVKFLMMMEVIPPKTEILTRFIPTFLDRPHLHRFLNVKYFLTKENDTLFKKYGYALHLKNKDITILKNQTHLPLGITYENYILKKDFEKLSIEEKDKFLFAAFVIDSTTALLKDFSQISINDIEKETEIELLKKIKQDSLKIISFRENRIQGNLSIDKPKLLLLSIPFDKGWKAEINGEKGEIIKVNNGLSGIMLKSGKYDVILYYSPPFMKIGLLITLISLVILFFFTKTKTLKKK